MSQPFHRIQSASSFWKACRSRLIETIALLLIASITSVLAVADAADTSGTVPQTSAPKGRGRRPAAEETTLPEASPEAIDAAIAKGVQFIYSQQKPDGRWELTDKRVGEAHNWEKTQGDTFGGFSALATYALLTAGEKPDDERMTRAINFLKKADVVGVYSLGLRAQVWHILSHDPRKKDEMQWLATVDADRLIANLNIEGDNRGLWDYGTGKGKRIDHSVSQYGILGLWALQDAGATVNIRYWHIFDEVWRKGQFPDGGWAYDSTPNHKGKQPHPSATMTAAGVATLFITQDNTYADLPDHHGNVFNSNIEHGLRWMTKHFNEVDSNYGWYGVERIGAASGAKYFGTIDWFQHGAEHLIGSQRENGSWKPIGPGNALTDTCFAVLFLARGRAPIMMNKLQYGIAGEKSGKPREADWNERPRDAGNLAQWTGDRLEGIFNWQLVNLQVPAENLRDAPILYIAGDQALKFTDDEVDKLKTFVHEGGMIVANADYNSKAFSDSVMTLGTNMFGYEFRPLEPKSPIWTENAHLIPANGKVLALSNGIRELMILLNAGDPARVWQTPPSHNPNSEPLELGANIFLYAIDKTNLESRGQSTLVLPKPGIETDRTISVARIRYGGNWDPEPGGWARLAAVFHNDHHTQLDVRSVALGHGDLAPFRIAHMTGTSNFVLSDEQFDELQKFVNGGGTLIIDSGGGSADFSNSAEELLKKLLPATGGKGLSLPLPHDNPLYTLAEDPIPEISYRRFARIVVGDLRSARVYGIPLNGRIAVYYSPIDISAGLVGQPTDGIVGYAPGTCTEIMRNMILVSAAAASAEPANKD